MKTFSVKNFDRFQHYKDRSPPWIKLYNELLDDYDFGRLQDASKLHLIAIWLLASRLDNQIPYDPKWIARRINATDRVDLDALQAAGFIVVLGSEQSASETLASRTQNACPEREGETEESRDRGRGETEAPRAPRAGNWQAEFSEFWSVYPLHKGKRAAFLAFGRALKRAEHSEIIAGAQRYANDPARKPDFTAHPATWLNQDRWLDEAAETGVERALKAITNGSAHDDYR